MAWKDKMQAATFRGVPFEVRDDDGSFGRRVQVHEYPQRDKPYAEDLGRAAREYSLTAFLIGDDYLDKRNRLLEALETKGPGILVHPWHGEMTVALKEPARVAHSIEHGGMCTVQMSFVEAGELNFPAAVDSLGAQTLVAADNVQAVASEDFASRFSVDGVASFVSADALATLDGAFDEVEGAVGGVAGLLANPVAFLRSQASELLPDSYGLGTAIFGMFQRGGSILASVKGMFGGGGASARNRDVVQALVSLGRTYHGRAQVASANAATDLSPSRRRSNANAAAINALFGQSVLVQAAGMTAAMELPVYDDAVAVRSALIGALDTASLSASDPVYLAVQDLRGKVHRDIAGRLSGSARLTTITPKGGGPALALAYDHFEDVGREGEIVELNRLRRPGFTAAQPLKVLSV